MQNKSPNVSGHGDKHNKRGSSPQHQNPAQYTLWPDLWVSCYRYPELALSDMPTTPTQSTISTRLYALGRLQYTDGNFASDKSSFESRLE